MATVVVEKLIIITDEDEKFVEELDLLCKKYAEQSDFYYSYRVED